jgi:SPP1 family predicted phage head-tail adaptor
MQAGKLNRRIAIQSQTTAQDSFGQELQTWTQVYACWANISVQNSQLINATAEFVSKVTHRVTLRYTSSVVIAANQRVVYKEQVTGVIHTYNIEAVLNTEQANKEIVVLAYEIGAKE